MSSKREENLEENNCLSVDENNEKFVDVQDKKGTSFKEKFLNNKAVKFFKSKIDSYELNKKLNNAFEQDKTIFLDLVYLDGKRTKKVLFKFDDSKCELYCRQQYNLSNLDYIENPKSGAKYYDVRILNDKIEFKYDIDGVIKVISCFIFTYKLEKPVENKQEIYNIGSVNQTTIGKNAIVGDGNAKNDNKTLSIGIHLPKNN